MPIPARHQGALAELEFALRASALGLRVARPVCDTAAYDFVLDSGRALSRVQVKSVSVAYGGCYRIAPTRGRRRKSSYTAADIDFLAAWVIPKDTWYIIPVQAFSPRKTIWLDPGNPRSRRRFEPFREAWNLLG